MEKFKCEVELGKSFSKGPCLFERNGVIEENPTCLKCEYYLKHISRQKIQKAKILKPKRPKIKDAQRCPRKKVSSREILKLSKMAQFRFECFKRSAVFEEISKLKSLVDQQKISKKDLAIYILDNSDKYKPFVSLAVGLVLLSEFSESDLASAFCDIPSIEVLNDNSDFEAIKQKWLKPYDKLQKELSHNQSLRDFEFGWNSTIGKDNTVSIKIHLSRRKKEILEDVRSLLDTLEKFDKYEEPNRRFPLNDFEKYFEVYDLRKEIKSWSRIAQKVLPKEALEELENAKRMVRHYYDQVERWLHEKV